MAEITVGLLKDKLIPLLTEEAYLLTGIDEEVKEIKCDLDYILAFLKDADAKAQTDQSTNNHGLKVWVEKLRRAAFEVEDVIDEYTYLMAQQQCPDGCKCIGFLQRGVFLIINLKSCHDIASKIKDIKQNIRKINARSKDYGFNSTQQQGSPSAESNIWYDPRNDSCFLKETEVVGIESTRDELIRMLEGGSPRRTVVSVVGMGGLGKTTLAHQVYVHIKERFDCHAWIEVSQSYNKVELLQKLMKKFCEARGESVPKKIDAMDEMTVATKIRDYLQGKSYIVIFDDVWNINFWGGIKNVLPDDNEKSGRIVITTRNVEVANFCKTSSIVHIHYLQTLPPVKAWELFCNKAFQYEYEGNCPTELNKLTREIVERCKGLPLAIVVIAGLLSTKNKTVDEWRTLLTSLSSELESNEHLTSITKILSLSYNDLPYYLKSCFLYFGIFPEDYSVRCGRLIRQWIAEGFVKSKKDKTLEVVAKEYMVELINRNLVQVSQIDFDGKAKTCRIHDLLREIILNKMEDLSFCQTLSGRDSNFKELTRRMSIVNGSHDVIKSNIAKTSHVRSIFVFDKDEMPNSLASTITTNFKLLKVLDFEDAPNLKHLHEDVGSLFHLKYLSVRGTKVRSLPKSIGKLENLETLDLKRSLVFELPVEIKRLHTLRHLLAYRANWKEDCHTERQKGLRVKRGIGQLKALQKLYFIEANEVVGVDIFEELSKLTELRKLGIKKLRSTDGRAFCDCIQKMNYLETLDIASRSADEIIDLESMSSPPVFLQRLILQGPLRKLPEWITTLQNLVRITIGWSKLEDDLLEAFQNLHNLLQLTLSSDAYYGEKLHFKEGAFQKLKVLNLRSLSKLCSLIIEEGALCNLEEFDFGPSPQLKELPSGFQHLKKLKKVYIWDMPIKFLMFQNFQTLQSTGANVLFIHIIHGEWLNLRLEVIMKILEYIRDHFDEEEWESRFENVWVRT